MLVRYKGHQHAAWINRMRDIRTPGINFILHANMLHPCVHWETSRPKQNIARRRTSIPRSHTRKSQAFRHTERYEQICDTIQEFWSEGFLNKKLPDQASAAKPLSRSAWKLQTKLRGAWLGGLRGVGCCENLLQAAAEDMVFRDC